MLLTPHYSCLTRACAAALLRSRHQALLHVSQGIDNGVLQVAVPFPTTAMSQQMLHTNQQVSSIGLLLADAQQVNPLLH